MNKEKILNKLNDEIINLTSQVELIENLKIEPVSSDRWHKICETPLRYTDTILDIAKCTFPYGKNFSKTANDVIFTVNGFKVYVPIDKTKGIVIDTSWYKKSILNDFRPWTQYGRMRDYFELIDSKDYTWYDLAMCRYNNNKNKSKKGLFIWWFTKAKWKKVDRELWENAFEIEDKKNEEAFLRHKQKQEEMLNEIEKFSKTVDLLKKWDEVKGSLLGAYTVTDTENL